MKDQYFGDVGDFGKYGLLRHLLQTLPQMRLGVNWFLTRQDARTDGDHIAYLLCSTELRPCDPPLYDFLQSCVANDRRSVRQIEAAALLGDTLFYNAPLDYLAADGQRLKRDEWRANWLADSVRQLAGAQLLYLDPDNGLQVKSQPLYGVNGVKYVAYHEVKLYYEKGFSLIVYNHRDRRPQQQYLDRFRRLYALTDAELVGLRFCRYSVRDYVFVLHHDVAPQVKNALERFVQTAWGTCFQLYAIQPRADGQSDF